MSSWNSYVFQVTFFFHACNAFANHHSWATCSLSSIEPLSKEFILQLKEWQGETHKSYWYWYQPHHPKANQGGGGMEMVREIHPRCKEYGEVLPAKFF